MKFKSFKILFIFLLSGIFLFWSQPSKAEILSRARYLNEETMLRGYTVPSKHYDFLVGIRGGIFNEPAWVKIKETDTTSTILPQGKELISAVYTYDIRVSDPQVLAKPIFLSLEFDSDTPYKKRIHFWNRISNEWQVIPTEIDRENKVGRAAIHFPWSKVAIFEDPTKLDEPIKITNDSNPSIQAETAIVIDAKSGKMLWEKDSNKEWWIASLTKLVTAIVFLETNPNFDQVVSYSREDNTIGGKLYLNDGETLTIKDLFYSLLTGSANNAANTLVRFSGLSREEFLARMNEKAKRLELSSTAFTDFSGLDLGNHSTAWEYAQVVREAARYFKILEATTIPAYSFRTINTGKIHTIENTNKLLDSNYYFLVGKTGYLDEARYNFAAKVRNKEGNEIITVLFGAGSDALRWRETAILIDWAYNNWEW